MFLENSSRKFKFHYNLARSACILHRFLYTFSTIYRSVLLRLIKSCRESPNTHFTFITFFFLKSYFNPLNAELNPICHLLALLGDHHIFHFSGLRVNEIMWKYNVQSERLQMLIWHMCIACWITKTKNTHS